MGTEVGDYLFMLFNLLCSELAFCAADGGAVRRVAAPYKGIAENLRKCEECLRYARALSV